MKTRKSSVEKTTETKRCAIYTRKSTVAGLEQEFNSLDAQHEACVPYIQRQPGWNLVDERYDDGGFTGANIDRPAFQRLLTDIEAGKIDIVVVYKVDRLSRSLLDFAKVMERFAAAGVSFVSVTQNFSTADAMGRLTLNMLMSFAEFEREMIAERTRDKVAAARRKGKWTGGQVPLGYTIKDKRLVVNELEAVLVRQIFALYLEHRSALSVLRMLKEQRHATKRHRAANGNLREAREWLKSDVLRVLKNPVYAGFMSCGKELYKAEHEPLVDQETFMRVQAILEAQTRRKDSTGRNPLYVLTGVIFCALCGSAFTPGSTKRGNAVHRYYRCSRRSKEGKDACASPPLPAAAIERHVVDRLRDALAGGALAADVTRAVKAKLAARRKDVLTERQKLPATIASLSAEARRTIDATAGMTGPARRLIDERLQELGDELARCQARLSAADRELASLDAASVEVGWVEACLADFAEIWDVLTPANRARLIAAVIERVEVDEPSNKVTVVLANLGAVAPQRVEMQTS